MEKIVIASGNPGKLREIARILAPLEIEAVPQSDFGVPDCPEPHVTFVENCLAKARHASAHTGLPALADDSGICVEALNGAPGVYSARYAGEPKSDARNNDKLITALFGQADRRAYDSTRASARSGSESFRAYDSTRASARSGSESFRAHYYCVMVLVRYADDPEPLIAEGRWFGEIIDTPRGENGFGYDPYFLVPEFGKTGAELGEDEKNAISHRGQALRELADKLKRLG